jgi:Rieske Fe-S protein
LPQSHAAALTRRTFVSGTCGAACAAVVSACATYGAAPASAPAPAPAPPAGSGDGAATLDALASASDIPVGGGTVFADQDVVVTQPARGEFRAFSATCTHQGCTVSEVTDGTINCNCHGSRFAVADGSVVGGPAGSPLPERSVQVTGGQILLA